MTNTMRKIGTYTIPEAYEYRYAGYETASAYDDYVIQPGTYDMVTDGQDAFVKVDARWTFHSYTNQLFSEYRPSHDTGPRDEMATVGLRWYLYQVAREVIEGSERIALDDELYAATVTYEYTPWKETVAKVQHTTGIFERATDNELRRV
jgi:hypothetical protein